MKKILEYRAVILFLALLGLGGLSYLAAGLRNVEFRAPEPFGFDFGETPGGIRLGSALEIPLWQIIPVTVILIFLLVISLLLVDPETRKRLLWIFFRYSLTFAVLFWAMNNLALKKNAPDGAVGSPAGLNGGTFVAEPPVYTPPQISPWLIFGVSLGLALLFLLVGWVLYMRAQKEQSVAPLAEIAGIARRAIDELGGDGGSWDEAIAQCYIRMNQAVTAQRGLVRQVDMTPSEFAARMERSGLPGEAARALTRLFEQVRYGGMTPTQDDRNLALAALNAILRACGATP